MKELRRFLKESLQDLPRQCQLLDRIMTLISRVQLNREILESSKIGTQLLAMRDNDSLEEAVKAKWFKYFSKFRPILEGWWEEREKKKRLVEGETEKKKLGKQKKKQKKQKKEEEESKKRRKASGEKSSSAVVVVMPAKKAVRFARDDELVVYKVFRREDEPNAPGLRPEEHREFLSNMFAQVPSFSGDEIKHRESQMEGRSHHLLVDGEQAMKEQVSFKKPFRIKGFEEQSKQSLQREYLQQRAGSKLGVCYCDESDIPKEPGMSFVSNDGMSESKVIGVSLPNDEEIIGQVKQLCEKSEREVVEKDLRRGGKKLHGILRRSPEEQHQREKELAEEKQSIPPKMKELHWLLENRREGGGERLCKAAYRGIAFIVAVIQEILGKLKATGNAQYIRNIALVITNMIEASRKWGQEAERLRERQLHVITAQRKSFQQKRIFNIAGSNGRSTITTHQRQQQQQQQAPAQRHYLPYPAPNLLQRDLFPDRLMPRTNPIAHLLPPPSEWLHLRPR